MTGTQVLSAVSSEQLPSSSHRNSANNSHIAVLIRSFDPLPRLLSLYLPSHATAQNILDGFASILTSTTWSQTQPRLVLCNNGLHLAPSTRLASIAGPAGWPLTLEMRVLLPGGKGGFGSMLRAQGGKMSSRGRNSNNDSCRDLNGRRLSTIKEAKKLADYLAAEPDRHKKLQQAQQKKYAKLERMLGRTPRSENDFAEATQRMLDAGEHFDPEASASTAKVEPVAGNKRKERIQDSEFIEQSREIVENVRSAVATGEFTSMRAIAPSPTAY